MASASLTLATADINALAAKLSQVQHRRPLMLKIGRALKTNTQQNFRASRAPDGTPWLPLKYRTGKPLLDTGRLRSSITFDATNDQVRIGTNVKYARAHNQGIPGKLPQRQFLGLAQPQVDLINSIADAWLEGILNG